MKTLWRLVVCDLEHDPKQALGWIRNNGRISIGPGGTRDLRTMDPGSAKMSALRSEAHIPINTFSARAARNLWNFYSEMSIGDLVILNARRPAAVVEVTGEYEYCEQYPLSLRRDGTPYRHQRGCLEIKDYDPTELWRNAGGAANGQNIRWTLFRCQNKV